LSALVSLQDLSITDFDHTLEDVIPEDMLSEPTDGDMMDVCFDIPDVGLEVSWAASRASSTLGVVFSVKRLVKIARLPWR
jgi:hypothetical protein